MALRTKLIVNLTRGDALCVGALADRPLPRMVGLMGRRGLPAGEGLLLSPAPGIHTAFMRFPIDALFLDADLRVVDIVERMRPWRMASRRRARAVLELAAGECARRGVRIGDRLGLHERKPVSDAEAMAARGVSADGEGKVIWPSSLNEGGELERLAPMRVLVVSGDRHFRSVTSMLLSHRGCSVRTTAKANRAAEMISRDRVDVVVIDAGQSPAAARTAATVSALGQPVGIVIVSDSQARLRRPPVLAKWGPFDDLFAAIETADQERGKWGVTA
jgi:uncharacterized membrane protein (UPF0127 family)/CheY-like chemotaxis protein